MIRYQRRVNPYPESAPVGLPPRSVLITDPVECFKGQLVADPLVFMLGSVYGSFIDLYSIARYNEISLNTPHTHALKSSMQTFRDFYYRCDLNYIVDGEIGVSSILTHIPNLNIIHSTMQRVFEENTRALGIPEDQRSYLLKEAQLTFDELLAASSIVTPEHLAMQSHLEHFISLGLPDNSAPEVDRAEELYAPLFKLRNKFFTAPAHGMLETYLELVESISKSTDYELLAEERALRAAEAAASKKIVDLFYGMPELEYLSHLLENDSVMLEVMNLMESTDGVLDEGLSR